MQPMLASQSDKTSGDTVVLETLPKCFELIVVEDDRVEAEAIARELSNRNIDVFARYAVDGRVALAQLLRLARQGRCDQAIFIVDLSMPLIDGLELLKQIRTTPEFCSASVYIYTGSDDPKLKAQAEELGVDGYFKKNELRELLATVFEKIS